MLVQLAKKFKHTIFAITIANIKKALTPKKHTDPTTKVLIKYYKHLKSFLQKKVNKLLKRQLYNYKIIIKIYFFRFGPLYKTF